jgi:hypothetical protein
MGEKVDGVLGCGFAILFFGFALIQMGAGWAGIENSFGWGWGVAAIVAAIFFRFTIPIAVGAFLCAKNIWEWHWFFALLFAAPALLFMIPAFFASLLQSVKR